MKKSEQIRRATLIAVSLRNAYVDKSIKNNAELYRKAADNLLEMIRGDDGRRVELGELQNLLNAMRAELQRLTIQRDGLLNDDLHQLALMASTPFNGLIANDIRLLKADAAVAWVKEFVHADGLQLSDRLWRLNRHTTDTISQYLQTALYNGEDAHHAILRGMGSGEGVPLHISKAYDASKAGALRTSIREVMTGAADPRTGKGVVYQAERLFRTELIRVHGEAYMNMAFNTDGVIGVRFMLSPRHPRPDVCDMHASADLYGLGEGVYPNRESCPWPAHPNTLSYVVAVMKE